MSVILWTPVLFPLLPTILQHRATGGKGGVAEAAAAAGLYLAVLMLVSVHVSSSYSQSGKSGVLPVETIGRV